MKETQRLADQLDRALAGDAWHGPAWRTLLEGVTREAALDRPVPSAHNIAEIVLHTITWLEVVRLRLQGESPEVSTAEDWPSPVLGSDAAWSAVLERLFGSGRSLGDTIRRFPIDRLHTPRPGIDETWFELIAGELQHLVYHEGQIGLLRRGAVVEGNQKPLGSAPNT